MKPFYLLLILVAITVASCAPHRHWHRHGGAWTQRYQDYQTCTRQAETAARENPQTCNYEEGGYVFSSVCKRERRQIETLTGECMQGRGYYRE